MVRWQVAYKPPCCMDSCFSPAGDTNTQLLWLKSLAAFGDYMVVGTFDCQPPQGVAHTDWSNSTVFLDRAINLPPKIMEFTSLSKVPASIRLTKSTKACWRFSSVDPVRRPLMCWGVMPSGPPDEPRGKVRSALITSSLETCKDSKRGLSPGSLGVRRSCAGPGCFIWSACSVSWLTWAGALLEQIIRIVALKLPASSLLDTAAASRLFSVDFRADLPSVVRVNWR